MSVLNDLRNEINSYAADFVTLDIRNVSHPGSVLNVNELAIFRVNMRNRGHMDIKNLRLHINGSAFGKVATSAAGPFSNTVTTSTVNLNAHASRTIGIFFFKAEKKTDGSKVIFSTHVAGFDLSFDHLLVDHTGHTSVARDSHAEEIFPV